MDTTKTGETKARVAMTSREIPEAQEASIEEVGVVVVEPQAQAKAGAETTEANSERASEEVMMIINPIRAGEIKTTRGVVASERREAAEIVTSETIVNTKTMTTETTTTRTSKAPWASLPSLDPETSRLQMLQ